MFRIKLALLVIGGVLLYFGVQEGRLASTTQSEPQAITLHALAANGAGDNAYVSVSDFMCTFDYVYETKEGSNTWQRCWVPAVPLDGAYAQQLAVLADEEGNLPDQIPSPSDFGVIFKINDVKSERGLDRVAMMDTVDGLVVNLIEGLGSDEKRILRESYPGVDIDKCYVVEIGREPASLAKTAGLIGGGGVMGLLGLAWLGAGLVGGRTPAA